MPRLSDTALIVENNLIIAMSAEVILLELGARHVETAASVKEAMVSVERTTPSFALLDLNLGNENSIAVGKRLYGLDVPFILATSYGERAPTLEDLSVIPVIQKPYTREVIEAALGRLDRNKSLASRQRGKRSVDYVAKFVSHRIIMSSSFERLADLGFSLQRFKDAGHAVIG